MTRRARGSLVLLLGLLAVGGRARAEEPPSPEPGSQPRESLAPAPPPVLRAPGPAGGLEMEPYEGTPPSRNVTAPSEDEVPRPPPRGVGTALPYGTDLPPPGFRYELRPRYGLVGAGFGVFGGAYAASVVVAVSARDGVVAIPLVGSAIGGIKLLGALGGCQSNDGFCSIVSFFVGVAAVLAIVDSLAQVGGLTMVILGYARPRRTAVPLQSIRFVPTAGRQTAGLSLIGQF